MLNVTIELNFFITIFVIFNNKVMLNIILCVHLRYPLYTNDDYKNLNNQCINVCMSNKVYYRYIIIIFIIISSNSNTTHNMRREKILLTVIETYNYQIPKLRLILQTFLFTKFLMLWFHFLLSYIYFFMIAVENAVFREIYKTHYLECD